ncbi:MAG: hypothetical protein JNJ71_16385 [Rubrivivax sp.]|nr:hypothetical protein [Rubrivivax sp.]
MTHCKARARLVGAALVALPGVVLAAAPPGGRCTEGVDYQALGFTVRSVAVQTLFGFLPWVQLELQQAQAEARERLEGKPFDLEAALRVRDELRAYGFARADPDQRLAVAWSYLRLERCEEGALDLRLVAAAPSIDVGLSGTVEALRRSRFAPEAVAGTPPVDASGLRWRLTPRLGWSPGDLASAGLRLDVPLRAETGRGLGWRALSADAERVGSGQRWALSLEGGRDVSPQAREAAASVGSAERDDDAAAREPRDAAAQPLALNPIGLSWRLDAQGTRALRDVANAWRERLTAQFMISDAPTGPAGTSWRVGGVLGTGRDAAAAADERVITAQLGLGLDARGSRHLMALSWGLDFSKPARGASLRRQLLDASLDLRGTWGARPVHLDQRLQAGWLQGAVTDLPGQAFRAGHREQPWLQGEDWQFREQPVIRGRPGQPQEAGARRFVAHQATLALTWWRQPLLPAAVREDPEITQAIEGALQSAASVLQKDHVSRDPAFQRVVLSLPALSRDLGLLHLRLEQLQPGVSAEIQGLLVACDLLAKGTRRRVEEALVSRSGAQVGELRTLLPGHTEQRLPRLQEACGTSLLPRLPDAALVRAVEAIEQHHRFIASQMALIDEAAAMAGAQAEVAPAGRTLQRLLFDTDLASASPLLMLDQAWLKPQGGGPQRHLLSLGLGLRLTLVSSVDLNLGVLRHLRRGPQDARSGGFLTLQFKDFF